MKRRSLLAMFFGLFIPTNRNAAQPQTDPLPKFVADNKVAHMVVEIMDNEQLPADVRLAAAEYILDRVYGKQHLV